MLKIVLGITIGVLFRDSILKSVKDSLSMAKSATDTAVFGDYFKKN